MTEFKFTTDDPSPSGIGIKGGTGVFVIDTNNPYTNTGCSFVQYLDQDVTTVVSGPMGPIPCNKEITVVLDFPAGYVGADFGFLAFSGPDSQGQAEAQSYAGLTITET